MFLIVILALLQFTAGLNVVFEWKSLATRYPDTKIGHLLQEEGVPFSLEVWHDMLFLAIPRWRAGVKASLSFVHLSKGGAEDRSPYLRPFPSWSWHNMHALVRHADALQSLLVSPFRARADRCNRLWVLDNGVADILGTAERIAPTRILVFHLETRHLLNSTALPESVTTKKSFHTNFVVDAEDCESAFAYIADDGDPALVVYDFANDTFWRITHPYFVENQSSSHAPDAPSSLALSTPVEGDPVLYLQLGRLNLSTRALKAMEMPDVDILNERSIVSGASDMDKWTDTFFYTQAMQKAVGCCNMMQHCAKNTEDIINTTLYPSDVRLDQHGNLWILETYAPPYNLTLPTSSGVKYRIASAPVEKVTKDLSCFNSNRKHFPNDAATRSVNVSLWITASVIVCTRLFIT